jgi:ribosomal protein S12 methylthiotransferase accessory factor YcaO
VSDAPPAGDLRIVSPGATPEEIAAVTAVLRAALEELAAAHERDGVPVVSAWQRSQRPIRATVTPGVGAWRSFSG